MHGIGMFAIQVLTSADWLHRFYCTFLGRWPLIPDLYFNVKLPSEAPYITSADRDAPTRFTDVITNPKLTQSMQSFLSAPGQRAERSSPRAVAAHAEKLKEEIIDRLHPAFRMEDPDTSWDTLIPTLPLKRAELHLIVYGVIEGEKNALFMSTQKQNIQ
jgi:hypothetical protein